MKNDKYKKARGGHSRLLDITCGECNEHVCYYQKDGPGILKRMYVDRMQDINPPDKVLVCSSCSAVLAHAMIYKKEGRPAFRVFVGSVNKKIVKAKDVV